MVNLRELLEKMIELKASDLHITAGLPPQFRIDGLITSSDYDTLAPDDCTRLAYSVLNDEQPVTARQLGQPPIAWAKDFVQIAGDQSFGEGMPAVLAHSKLLEGPKNGPQDYSTCRQFVRQ